LHGYECDWDVGVTHSRAGKRMPSLNLAVPCLYPFAVMKAVESR
jgi:hypothetical protein